MKNLELLKEFNRLKEDLFWHWRDNSNFDICLRVLRQMDRDFDPEMHDLLLQNFQWFLENSDPKVREKYKVFLSDIRSLKPNQTPSTVTQLSLLEL